MVMRHTVLTVAEVAKERQLRPERSRREGAQRLIGWEEEGGSLEGKNEQLCSEGGCGCDCDLIV